MSEEKVVYLAASNPNLVPETITVLSCGTCRNKTFMIVYDSGTFPNLKCGACATAMGRIGWVPDEDSIK